MIVCRLAPGTARAGQPPPAPGAPTMTGPCHVTAVVRILPPADAAMIKGLPDQVSWRGTRMSVAPRAGYLPCHLAWGV